MKQKKLSTRVIIGLTVLSVVVIELLGWAAYHELQRARISQAAPITQPTTAVICNCPETTITQSTTIGPGPCHCPQ